MRLARRPEFLLSCLLIISSTVAQSVPSDDDVKKSALEKGKLAAEYWVKRSGINPSTTDYYADICSFYAACIFGEETNDSSFYKEINNRYNRTTAIKTDNIDNNSCGILPLHLYLHNKKDNLLKLGTDAAKANIQKSGHFRNAIDDTYMTGSLMVQAYKATANDQYLDFCINFILRYVNNLQQSNGLYWHHGNISHQFWGRGNGWGAASMAELVRVIPDTHEKYNDIITAYKKHMKGLIDAQLSSGMWPQLLMSTDSRNWEETSGSSMFVFALFTGLELGLLDKETYLDPAKKGWMAVTRYLGNDGRLGNIAEGFWPSKGDANEYLSARKAAAGNSHGTAGYIWAATAVLRYYNNLATSNRNLTPATHNNLTIFSPENARCFDLNGRSRSLSVQKSTPSVSTGMLIRRNGTAAQTIVRLQ